MLIVNGKLRINSSNLVSTKFLLIKVVDNLKRAERNSI